MRRTILVVVADPSLRAILRIALAADGHQVRVAVDAAEARSALGRDPPDILLLDGTLLLDGVDGVRWAERHAAAIPLVLLVPASDPRPVVEQRPIALLPMPFDIDALRRTIAACLSDHTQ